MHLAIEPSDLVKAMLLLAEVAMVLAIVLLFLTKSVKASDMAPLPVQVTELPVLVTEVLVLVTELLELAMVLHVLATVLLGSVTVPEMALLVQDMVPEMEFLVQDMVPVMALLVLATVHLEKAMALAMVPLVADMAAVLAAMVTGPEVMEPFLRLRASVKMVVSLTRLAPTSALEVTKALPIFHLEACSTLLSASAKLAVSTINISISPMEEAS